MVDAADTNPSAAVASGAAIPAAGGTVVGPDIQIVTDPNHPDRHGGGRGCGDAVGATWISSAVPIVASSRWLPPFIRFVSSAVRGTGVRGNGSDSHD
jgi:hypothetical protein